MKTTASAGKSAWFYFHTHSARRAAMLLLLVLALPAIARAQFTFTTNNGVLTVTGYTGPGGEVIIPSTTNGLPVKSVGDHAFQSCPNLTGVAIPSSITNIDVFAFWSCTNLVAITVDPANARYSDLAGVLCSKDRLTLVMYPCGRAGGYTMPDGVTSIGDHAFQCCTNLTGVTIPNSVTNIADYAFQCCVKLTSINIPDSVTHVGIFAFYLCSGLTSVTIGNGVTSIAGWVFYKCTSLPSVTIPHGVTNIANNAFDSCTNLASVTIPDSVISITTFAFLVCRSLTNLTLPDSVAIIGDHAFAGCASLTSITVPDSVRLIGDAAFMDCTSLTNLAIGNGVTNIGRFAFDSCSNLTAVTIGSSVGAVEDYSFQYCSRLDGVHFNGNAPGLGGPHVFTGDNHATIYYPPGTTGWGPTFGGRPTALWSPPIIAGSPHTQTVEEGAALDVRVQASGGLPLFYLWYYNGTNLLGCTTNCDFAMPGVQFSQSGTYVVVVSNACGAVTSAPFTLNVIAAVARRPVPGLIVNGGAGSLLNLEIADSLGPAASWQPWTTVTLAGTPQYCFDLSEPLPLQRFYRTTGGAHMPPVLALHLVPALTLTGNVGDSVRVDCINRYGPIDAWVTLNTVSLTNTSQLFLDTVAWGQPERLYRLVPVP